MLHTLEINIRPAVLSDAIDMAEVYMGSFEAAYKNIIPADYIREKRVNSNENMIRVLSDENYSRFQYVILHKDAIVGVMTVAPARDDDTDDSFYELHGIYISPNYFRQGIGAQAINFALDKARTLGKQTMILWVFADNICSIKFYEKSGFITDGKTRTLNCGKPLIAIRMRREINSQII